jgi:rfaE bifunctional protein nucleotidyltransferase chain/domain
MIQDKIYSDLDTLLEKIKEIESKFKSIVFTNGVFDIFHAGHALYLEKAKSYGDFLIVAVNSDDSVKRLKGLDRPLNDETNRMIVLASHLCVDAVLLFNTDTPLSLINQIKPDFLIKGGDYTISDIVGNQEVSGYGGKVLVIPFEKDISTSKIIEKIKGNL